MRQEQEVRPANGGRLRGGNGRYVARSKPPANKTGKRTAEIEKEPPLRPRECAGHLRKELARSFRGIVSGFVKQAESGSVQHLKLTTELLDAPPVRKRGKGSAELLLERMRQAKEREPAVDEDVWRE